MGIVIAYKYQLGDIYLEDILTLIAVMSLIVLPLDEMPIFLNIRRDLEWSVNATFGFWKIPLVRDYTFYKVDPGAQGLHRTGLLRHRKVCALGKG